MKSQESGLLVLAECIIRDAYAKCTANKPEERDFVTLKKRIEHESVSFLTITLPNMGQDFERCLSHGCIETTDFQMFRKFGRIPAFLRGIFSLVFDTGTGGLLDEPEIPAIEAIRQIAYAFKKVKLPCTARRDSKAIKGYVECEQDLEKALDLVDIDIFTNVSDIIWGNSLPGSISVQNAIPKHGPGSNVERILGNSKNTFLTWHSRLEPYFPLLHWAFPNENAIDSVGFQCLSTIDVDSEEPVKVITVPKTLKGPRIIAMEPVCMQYTQQALSRELIASLESSHLTNGHINFKSQKVNRKLAIDSSRDLSLATLDMSSASDRVPHDLALRMFDSVPDFRDAIDSCRSRRAQLPTGQVIALKKFASMGSALCFPIEAMYFYTICVIAQLVARKLPVTYHNIYNVSRYVFVYGDDILVPTDTAVITMETLHKYYCKVNIHKSFWTGKFRESCGMDAYCGEEVTPTYIRSMQPHGKRDASAILSWVATSNLFYKRGYWLTADHMVKLCESIIGTMPVVGEDCAGIGLVSYQYPVIHSEREVLVLSRKRLGRNTLRRTTRWNPDYHIYENKMWVAAPTYRKDRIGGYSALLKCLLMLENPVTGDKCEQHLEESVRRGAVTLKRRWVRPY